MPKIPVSENRVQARSVNVDPMKVGMLGQGVTGNNVIEAAQKTSDTIGRAGTAVADYFNKQQEQETQKKILTMSSSAFGELDDLLYNPGTTDEGKPKGLLNRKLGQVGEDTVMEYDSGVAGIISKYSEGLDEDSALRLQSSIGTHARTLRDNVAKHQVKERDADFENVSQSNLKIQIGSAASALNKDALDDVVLGIHGSIEGSMRARGMDAASIQLAKQNATDKAIETNIFSKLESDPATARAVLIDNESKVSPEFFQKTKLAIEGKVFENKRSGLYSDVFSKMKLSNGEPNLAKIENTIRSSQSMTEPEKEKMVDYAKSRALEDLQNKNRYDKDLINRFSNDVINLKKQGGTLDEAFKVAGKFGGDNVDVKEREDIAKKLWTDPGMKSDPDTLIALHEKNLTGGASRSEIKQKFADNKINANDYVRLTNEHLAHKLGEAKDEDKLAYQSFKNQVNGKFYSATEKADALLVYMQKTKGKTPEESVMIGKQLLESVEVPSKLWGTRDEVSFKVEKEKIDANNAVWGTLHQEIGAKEVSAIGGGFIRNGAKSWGASDVDKFAREFGGVEAIKQGTPVNNAIKSLAAKGKMATAANVKAVLAIYKDGNY